MKLAAYFAARRWSLAWVVAAALFTLLRAGPLFGSDAALALTVVLQFYLSGYLLVRALRLRWSDNGIVNFAWVLLAAFGLNVTLAGIVRLLQMPVPVYAPILLATMLVLALLAPPGRWPALRFGRPSLKRLLLYGLVAACCLIVTGVALERSQYRFSDYEDQTVFVELADWLALDSGDVGQRSRRVGVTGGDARWDSDGWTYTHALWSWTSGVSAADLIWFRLTPLFVWTVPLAVYALAYELTRREESAAWSTVGLTLIGLLTVDSLVYYPTTITFGQFSLFQVNSLRTIATGLVTPLALIPAVRYLASGSRRTLVLLLLTGVALALMHPRPIVIVAYSAGAMAALAWLAKPSRRQLQQVALLGLVLALLLAVPFAQRLRRPAVGQEVATMLTPAAPETDAAIAPASGEDEIDLAFEPDSAATGIQVTTIDRTPRARMLGLSNLPLIGETVIIDPEFVFYHPLFVILTVIGLGVGLAGWRRSLTAQYVLGATLVSLALLFVPVLAAVFIRLVTPTMAPGAIFGVPFALIFGLMLERGVGLFGRLVRSEAAGTLAGAVLFAAAVALLLFEPVLVTASARDQIRASNLAQAARHMRASDQQLVNDLRGWLHASPSAVVVSPNRVANFISEDVPGALITGGRASSNDTFGLTETFMAEDAPPWLTADDFAEAAEWGVTHVVMPADNWRVGQLRLMPETFELLGESSGYVVFGWRAGAMPAVASVYAEINDLIDRQESTRWTADGFDLTQPANPDGWAALLAALEDAPQDDSALYARAFVLTMLGDDASAAPLWADLHDRYPDVALFAETAAASMAALDQPERGQQLLFAATENGPVPARLLAARALLSPTYFYLLSDAELDALLELIESNPVAWDLLAQMDQLRQVRERAALLLGAGRWDVAAEWLRTLPEIEWTPDDIVTLATVELLDGRVDAALALLEPTTDADWTMPNRFVHADRWADNSAAQTYHLLQGELALRDGRAAEAVASFEQAVAAGPGWVGPAFLAQALRANGDTAAADSLEATVSAAWREQYGVALPAFTSLLTLTESHNPYVSGVVAEADDSAGELRVSAGFGSPIPQAWPVQSWLFQLISPDGGTTYVRTEVPAVTVSGALVSGAARLPLAADLPELTQALLFVEPRYDNRVTFMPASLPVVLNRPDAADTTGATPTDARLGESIKLAAYEAALTSETLCLRLYWQADSSPAEDYQVFVHVMNAAGEMVGQVDSAPVGGRYPTSWWRIGIPIEDRYRLAFAPPLPEGAYRVLVGMYSLETLARLPVVASGVPVSEDRIELSVTMGGDLASACPAED